MQATDIKITHCLGIDISKASYHAALLGIDEPDRVREKSFANNPAGHRELVAWIGKQVHAVQVHGCMEATGPYGDELAILLHAVLGRLSVENPRRIKGYAGCRLRRNKSDSADARLIALYCATQKPLPWQRPTDGQFKIRALSRRMDSLKIQLNAEQNRLGLTREPFLKKDLKAHIKFLVKHIAAAESELLATIAIDAGLARQHQLIEGIKGIGALSAAIILAEMPDLAALDDARQLAAYAGVTPRHNQSGTSGSSHTPMSKAGSPRLRKALFFPAMSAMRFNPPCMAFAQRLKEKGKKPIVIIGAIMTKLLHLIFGILRSGKPFDPAYQRPASVI